MSELRLSIPAKPEYVVFSRLVLTGLARTTEIDEETLGDLKVAVTEACSRSVRASSAGCAGVSRSCSRIPTAR